MARGVERNDRINHRNGKEGRKKKNKGKASLKTSRIIFFSPSSMTRNGATAAARPPSFLEPRSACHHDKLCAFQFQREYVIVKDIAAIGLLQTTRVRQKHVLRFPHWKVIARNPCIGKHRVYRKDPIYKKKPKEKKTIDGCSQPTSELARRYGSTSPSSSPASSANPVLKLILLNLLMA